MSVYASVDPVSERGFSNGSCLWKRPSCSSNLHSRFRGLTFNIATYQDHVLTTMFHLRSRTFERSTCDSESIVAERGLGVPSTGERLQHRRGECRWRERTASVCKAWRCSTRRAAGSVRCRPRTAELRRWHSTARGRTRNYQRTRKERTLHRSMSPCISHSYPDTFIACVMIYLAAFEFFLSHSKSLRPI